MQILVRPCCTLMISLPSSMCSVSSSIYVATCTYYPFRSLPPGFSTFIKVSICLKYLKLQMLRASLIINLISNISTVAIQSFTSAWIMPSKMTELSTLDPRSPALWMDANIFKASAAWWLTVDRMKAKHFWGITPPNVIFISGQEKMKKHISCNIPNVCLYMNLVLFMLLNLSSMNVSNVLQKILPLAN